MLFSKSLFQGGELVVDHRASPGLTEEQARRMGHPPGLVGEGQLMITDTWGCPHCGGVFARNPTLKRNRERNHCYICNRYICYWCDMAMHEPDYVHYTINELAEKCRSGRFMCVGPDMQHLKLVPIGEGNG